MDRRHFLVSSLGAALVAVPNAVALAGAPGDFRIGYQKFGPLLIAKQQQRLEQRLEPLGIRVKWVEFSFGPPLLERSIPAISTMVPPAIPRRFLLRPPAPICFMSRPSRQTGPVQPFLCRKDHRCRTWQS